ncbi:MAG: RluA family pseudouridine synthase [Candidatus Nomurabacteria bacterium]|jgi:23S rRNA pseudouridine1911/1915/1917 synthase|nr:RluA family pseudouridine synthase [Candidatus Nomurabacteria bacterium]
MRLDLYLATKFPEYSRSTWAKLIRRGSARLNGAVVSDSSQNVKDSDVVTVDKPDAAVTKLDLPVIFEDDNVVVIDKPAGVLTHSKGALNEEFTVSDFIRGRAAAEAGDNRFGIVHRLDRATSGVIIGAKNTAARKVLQKQFAEHKAKKTYLAVVDISPLGQKTLAKNGAEFTIDLPIGRNPKRPSQFRVDAKGKPATTEVKVVETISTKALLELRPLTGRTHQLRVHLSRVGLPIVGDLIYGTPNETRMMLHAWQLEITIPDGQRKTFKAKVPNEFKQL